MPDDATHSVIRSETSASRPGVAGPRSLVSHLGSCHVRATVILHDNVEFHSVAGPPVANASVPHRRHPRLVILLACFPPSTSGLPVTTPRWPESCIPLPASLPPR